MLRIGIDIGGTFTDFAVWRGEEGFDRLIAHKEPSTPPCYEAAVRAGLDHLLPMLADVSGEEVLVVHGMTVATNTVIERAGARLALLVTAGFRDILHLGRLRVPRPTDLFAERPAPLIPRALVYEIPERLLADGTVDTPLDMAAVEAAARNALALGVTGLVVCFLHSHTNPVHERAAQEAIFAAAPQLDVVISSEVWPQQGEYERATLAVLNAYVRPVMTAYLEALESLLADRVPGARLLIARSNGGSMSVAEARRFPVHTLLSGPAAGVAAAAHLGRLIGRDGLLTMDMGGTSTDMSLVADGAAITSPNAEVGDFPLAMPVTAIEAMGAGGGSLVWLDGEVLRVGPRSAGSRPGPACYALGGTRPTLSDAYLLCGLLGDTLLGGRLRLDRGAAEAALRPLAERLGIAVADLAGHCVAVTTATMLARALPFLARLGADPAQLTMLVFGGAGAIHGPLLAAEMGIPEIVVPPSPSVFCAAGCVVSNLMHEAVRTVADPPTLDPILAALDDEISTWLNAQLTPPALCEYQIDHIAGARYRGQAFQVDVGLPPKADRAAAERGFHAAHARLYAHADEAAPVEIVELRARITGTLPAPGRGVPAPPIAATAGFRRVLLDGIWHEAVPVLRRESVGQPIAGPALIEQPDATLLVPPGFIAAPGMQGELIVRRS